MENSVFNLVVTLNLISLLSLTAQSVSVLFNPCHHCCRIIHPLLQLPFLDTVHLNHQKGRRENKERTTINSSSPFYQQCQEWLHRSFPVFLFFFLYLSEVETTSLIDNAICILRHHWKYNGMKGYSGRAHFSLRADFRNSLMSLPSSVSK